MVEKEMNTSSEEIQLVVFDLGKEEYGIEINQAREIIKTPEITVLPNSPSFIKGIINLRGKIVVAVDLADRFNIKNSNKSQNIIVAETGERNLGLVVDSVKEILRAEKKLVKKTPGIISTKIHADYLQGVLVSDKRMIILLDLKKVLSEKELAALAEEEKKGAKHFEKTKLIKKN